MDVIATLTTGSRLRTCALITLIMSLPLPGHALEFVDGGTPDPARVELGRLLFHDKALSGNNNTSCATCHHPLTDTGDGLSLSVGEGGVSLGAIRSTGSGPNAIVERVPRNAPPLFALGSTAVTHLFHDGRVTFDGAYPSGFKSPAGYELPAGLDNILAAQAVFPVTSATEMAGQVGENPIAGQAAAGNLAGSGGVWQLVTQQVLALGAGEYEPLFMAAFDGIGDPAEINIVHIANAIAAFEIAAWRADNSPWDAYRAGNSRALNKDEKQGAKLFFGKAGCASCHSGELFSDMRFHAIAMPQIGPGKGDGYLGHDDFGRFRETGDTADLYAFRTPPLRNVALTAPYGHSGAYNTLAEVVYHHLNPQDSLWAYQRNNDCHSRTTLPYRDDLNAVDCQLMSDQASVQAIADAASGYTPVELSDEELRLLLSFLHALTDRNSLDLRGDIPQRLPGGRSVAE